MGISLFPCLAVLICTMGALIVLLIVVARVARTQAAQAAAHDVAEIKADKEVLEVRISQLQQARQKTAAQLEEERLRLSGVEDHLRRLREQLQRQPWHTRLGRATMTVMRGEIYWAIRSGQPSASTPRRSRGEASRAAVRHQVG
jgi:uncharacterized protein YlxW (UPF0749 family)